MLPLDGFGTVHDPLAARVVLLTDDNQRIAIAVVDQTSMPMDQVEAIQTRVAAAGRLQASDVVVVASHTFSAPHAFDPSHLTPGMTLPAGEAQRTVAYRAAILSAVSAAAAKAAGAMKPAIVRFGLGASNVNVNRNHLAANGWWLGADDNGYSDKTLGVLALETPAGAPIATLVNFGVQSSVMDHSVSASGTKSVTADLGGGAMREIEQLHPGIVALFLTGAAGDQMPAYTARHNIFDASGNFQTVDLGDKAFLLSELQGQHLADAVLQTATARTSDNGILRVVHGSIQLDGQDRPKDLQQIKPTRDYRFTPAGKVDTPFVIAQIGDTTIIGVQAELSAVTGTFLRTRSPFKNTLVVTMVNGAAKYMPEREAYQRITYEAMNSSFAPGSAERLAAEILQRLRMLRSDKAR